MTVNTTNITSGPYVGTGLATEYSYDFRIQDVSQLLVYETDTSGVRTLLTQGTDYTVSGVGDDNGGLVTRLAGALPTGYIWYIRSNYPQTQLTAFRSQGGFSPAVHEDEFDKTTFLIQQLQDQADRAFRLNSELDIDGTFTLDKDKTDRATTVLGFDANGNLIVLDQNTVSTIPAIFVQSATLIAGQTVVTFSSAVENSSMYISGLLVDNGRLVEGVDYTQNITTNTVTLTESYPAGTLLTLVYNDIGTSVTTGQRLDFGSVAQLKSSTLSTGVTATTQGYTTGGDGGGGTYYIMSIGDYGSTPDGYIDHLIANGNVAVLMPGDEVNVLQGGAVGDGTTDETALLQGIIDAAGAGATIIFPEGRTFVFGDHDADTIGLKMKTGQTWKGGGTLLLNPAETDIIFCIRVDTNAVDFEITDLVFDGNRSNITPTSDLYSTFNMIVGPVTGKRGTYKNFTIQNSWGRALQSGFKSGSTYSEDMLVDGVRVLNSGTKAISISETNKGTITNCFAEVDPYAAADHGGTGDATSGSCFEIADSHKVTVSNNHGVQLGATIYAPGIRLVNSSYMVKVFGNTIDDASYLGFIQNVNDVSFFGNIGNAPQTGFIITDADADEPTTPCKRINIYDNHLIDCASAGFLTSAEKSGYNSYVEVFIFNNHIYDSTGAITSYVFYNKGVIAPAIGGSCLVYQWDNTITGINTLKAGNAPEEIQGKPDSGYVILEQSGVAVSHTGDTTETNLAVITVPAWAMGKNGRIRIKAHWSYSNNANNKFTRVRWNSAQITSATNTTSDQQKIEIEITNRNSLSSQIISQGGNNSGFGISNGVITGTANTATNINIGLTGQLSNAADTITLESYSVEVFYEV